jgi:hypothetical protein
VEKTYDVKKGAVKVTNITKHHHHHHHHHNSSETTSSDEELSKNSTKKGKPKARPATAANSDDAAKAE